MLSKLCVCRDIEHLEKRLHVARSLTNVIVYGR